MTPAPADPHSLRRRAAAIVVVSVLLAAVVSLESLHTVILHWLEALRALMAGHPRIAALAFVAFAAAGAMLAFVSSSVLVPAAVATWGAVLTALLLWLGWMLGGVAMYLIGRLLGVVTVRLFVSEEKVASYQRRIGAGAPFSLVFLFQLALPSEIPGYVLGILRYPLPKYLLALALAELPYAVGVTFAGESFLQGRRLPLLAVGLLAASLSVLAWRRLHGHPALRPDADSDGSSSPIIGDRAPPPPAIPGSAP